MKVHLLTIGEPKLDYARSGWREYLDRLNHYHTVRITHLSDKYAYDAKKIQEAIGNSYSVVLEIEGQNLSSSELAMFLEKRAQDGREVTFVIGGPEGLPQEIIEAADLQWSFSKLTFPHDLAMVVLVEALYRASSINAGQKYHK